MVKQAVIVIVALLGQYGEMALLAVLHIISQYKLLCTYSML